MPLFLVPRLAMYICLIIWTSNSFAQPKRYTANNAHSHNDYEQRKPFIAAFENGFGSIEVDVFLIKNRLIVAHDIRQTAKNRTLDSLYLIPLQRLTLLSNEGFKEPLQLMIDIKTHGDSTLNRIVEVLATYKEMTTESRTKGLKFLISGNRPEPSKFNNYPAFISFDGELGKEYSPEALQRIEMLSDNFKKYSSWNGSGKIAEADLQKLQAAVSKAHALGKKVRFWNAPDNREAWEMFKRLGVDFINTDKIAELAAFLR